MNVADDMRWHKYPVLDQGWLCLADVMGTDQTIVERARGTSGTSSQDRSKDRELIRFMMRHHHGSSFEFAEIDVQFCVPFFAWRQIIRHRAGNLLDDASCWDEPSVNELSGRYSTVPDMIQETPADAWRLQSKSNRQGSSGKMDPVQGSILSERESWIHQKIRGFYGELIDCGVAKEQARKVWPMGGYTIGNCKMDLRNWLHWLALRLSPDAQYELRQYAQVVAREIISRLFPVTWQAFQDYVLNAVTFSAPELAHLRYSLSKARPSLSSYDGLSARESDEFNAKIARILDES